jgi:hypothetical protein
MEKQYPDNEKLVDFDELQKMLVAGEVDLLIGYTSSGDRLVAVPSVEQTDWTPDAEPDPILDSLQFFGFKEASVPLCCKNGQLHYAFRIARGYRCVFKGGPCGDKPPCQKCR